MTSENRGLSAPRIDCHTLIVSDTHLGKTQVKADYLLELLYQLDQRKLKRIILNGDIFDGWALENHKAQRLPEIQLRVMDAINAMAAGGVEVTYIAGNHDETLRDDLLPDKDLKKGERSRAQDLDFLDPRTKTINFSNRDKTISAPITFRRGMVLETEEGQKYAVQHGDQFDSWVSTGIKKWLAEQASTLYYNFLSLEDKFNKAAKGDKPSKFAKLVGISKWMKKEAKNIVGVTDVFEAAARNLPKEHGLDGMICGHIHEAKIENDTGYMNSGDWDDIHGCTALIYNPGERKNGGFKLMHWLEEREGLGLTKPPTEQDDNPYAEYRDISMRQARLISRLWEATNRKALVKEMKKLEQKHDTIRAKLHFF